MKKVSDNINDLLKQGTSLLMNASDEKLSQKPAPGKWSPKEIIGHLIDSALHNLVRFTESHYLGEPYQHRKYDQEKLVLINDYQNQETEDLLVLWLSLNRQISKIIASSDEKTIARKVTLYDGTSTDLKFLMTDYADHLEHHIRQLTSIFNIC